MLRKKTLRDTINGSVYLQCNVFHHKLSSSFVLSDVEIISANEKLLVMTHVYPNAKRTNIM